MHKRNVKTGDNVIVLRKLDATVLQSYLDPKIKYIYNLCLVLAGIEHPGNVRFVWAHPRLHQAALVVAGPFRGSRR